MAKYWCTNCKKEVEHREKYCHSRCGNNCEAACYECNKTTLTSLFANPGDDIQAAIRHATGEAQRRVQKGEFDADTGSFKILVLVYNTDLKKATATRPSGW